MAARPCSHLQQVPSVQKGGGTAVTAQNTLPPSLPPHTDSLGSSEPQRMLRCRLTLAGSLPRARLLPLCSPGSSRCPHTALPEPLCQDSPRRAALAPISRSARCHPRPPPRLRGPRQRSWARGCCPPGRARSPPHPPRPPERRSFPLRGAQSWPRLPPSSEPAVRGQATAPSAPGPPPLQPGEDVGGSPGLRSPISHQSDTQGALCRGEGAVGDTHSTAQTDRSELSAV